MQTREVLERRHTGALPFISRDTLISRIVGLCVSFKREMFVFVFLPLSEREAGPHGRTLP